MTKPARVKVRVSTQPVVVMEAEVARKIRQHARSSMKAEVCGVLIGSTEHERMMVEACIQGNNAAQGGAHVTFTQDTWEHIYKIKDKDYPDQKIVGWYHSHPGFGVFLSEHDLFIQQNFFSNPQQVAWVYDPHTDEEGCFGWIGDKIEKLSAIRVGYSQSVEITAADASQEVDDVEPQVSFKNNADAGSQEPAWMVWTGRILGYLSAVLLGFVLSYLFFPRLVLVPVPADDPHWQQLPPAQQSNSLLPGPGQSSTPPVAAQPHQDSPAVSAPKEHAAPKKDNNAKH